MIDKKEKLKTEWVNNTALDILNNLNSWIYVLGSLFFSIIGYNTRCSLFCFCLFLFFSGAAKRVIL